MHTITTVETTNFSKRHSLPSLLLLLLPLLFNDEGPGRRESERATAAVVEEVEEEEGPITPISDLKEGEKEEEVEPRMG
ncbi:hypothetical protein G4B88_028275 [Cannabis sativa]|uniref:Uncharacterized protein n=1 Tax=Cannabis sativa TaxID=3483 RepID=A0A7J6GDK2_CANSA|nr:hypothetical protein G4B88_009560 [Cannabis sativa]KAF4380902.1 hypothetical protein G4B88_028275 [Cannabis sativa]